MPIGDGFPKSIEHPHFLKVATAFVILVILVWAGYHLWVRKQAAVELQQAQQFQAQR